MLDRTAPLLQVKDLQAWYGESHILHGVSFDVREGEVVTRFGTSTKPEALSGAIEKLLA